MIDTNRRLEPLEAMLKQALSRHEYLEADVRCSQAQRRLADLRG